VLGAGEAAWSRAWSCNKGSNMEERLGWLCKFCGAEFIGGRFGSVGEAGGSSKEGTEGRGLRGGALKSCERILGPLLGTVGARGLKSCSLEPRPLCELDPEEAELKIS